MCYNHHTDDLDDDEGITCKRCGEGGLYWQKVFGKDGTERAVLYDSADDKPHVCDFTNDF